MPKHRSSPVTDLGRMITAHAPESHFNDLARLTGVSRASLSRLNLGARPNRETAARLAAALGISADEVFAAASRRVDEPTASESP